MCTLKEWEDGDIFNLDPDDNGENPVQISGLSFNLDPAGDVVIGTDATISLNWTGASVTEGTLDDDAKAALAATLYCTSSNTGVARVYKDNGVWKVKGVAAGENANITVSVGNASFYGTATQTINVTAAPTNP